jgi:predicted amidohydrolase
MRAACLQLEVKLCQREDNLGRAVSMARSALQQGAEILVFPELFLTGFCYQDWAWDLSSFPSLEPFRELSEEHGCLIIGSLMSGSENVGFCLEPSGLQTRPKIHPFGPEKEHFRGGEFVSPAVTRWGKVGLSICYDLRFPEVARSLCLQGADFLVTIAQFPAERRAHWRALCIARAIENQIPHLACNWSQGGGSLIIDSWGEVVAEAGREESLIFGKVELLERDQIRRQLPCFSDRRPEIY